MDTTSSRKQQTRDRIVDTAARVLRETGFQGVGVADIMKRVGLTHGGFYAHFPSREALVAEALQRAGEDGRARMELAVAAAEARGVPRLQAIIERYLSDAHLQSPDTGCPVAALASDMPRQADAVRDTAQSRIRSLQEYVAAALPPGHAPEAASLIVAQMVGALQIARTLGDNDEGRRHLAAARRFLLEQFQAPRS